MSSLFHPLSLSLNLFLSLILSAWWWSHATTPGSPPVLPTLARLLLPKAINPWNQGAEAARGIIHKKWAQFNTRGQRWLAAFPSMAWKTGQRRWPSINFPSSCTIHFFFLWDSRSVGFCNWRGVKSLIAKFILCSCWTHYRHLGLAGSHLRLRWFISLVGAATSPMTTCGELVLKSMYLIFKKSLFI